MGDPDVTTFLFRISDPDHPHYPETGRLTGEVVSLFGKPMAKLKLDHCRHGTDACFVTHGQVRQIPDPASRLPKRRQVRNGRARLERLTDGD